MEYKFTGIVAWPLANRIVRDNVMPVVNWWWIRSTKPIDRMKVLET